MKRTLIFAITFLLASMSVSASDPVTSEEKLTGPVLVLGLGNLPVQCRVVIPKKAKSFSLSPSICCTELGGSPDTVCCSSAIDSMTGQMLIKCSVTEPSAKLINATEGVSKPNPKKITVWM